MKLKTALVLTAMLFGISAHAEEGMFTLDNLPVKAMQDSYGFTPSQAWQDLLMKASVRLALGCSGSFVSGNGLLMTNHHCAEECLSQVAPERDYNANGFIARRRDEEARCPDFEINQLLSITDVTERVAKYTAEKSGSALVDAQRKADSAIEKECVGSDAATVRCDVVSLYKGGVFGLYKYRRYEDVRLVFAPEIAVAAFGGDPDNFNFPRYDLDLTFLRAYVDGKPAMTPYFKFDFNGPKAGELIFTIGNPGGTERVNPVVELDDMRINDMGPFYAYLLDMSGMLWQYGNESAEHAKEARDEMLSVQNTLKVFEGDLETLNDAGVIAERRRTDQSLAAWIKADPARVQKYGDPLAEMAQAAKANASLSMRYSMLDGERGFNSTLYHFAKLLVRAGAERSKPDAERLPAYRDARLPEIEAQLLAETPVYPDFDATKLSWSLTKLRQRFGPDDPLVHQILGNDTTDTVAARLVKGSGLASVAYRKQLFEGGQKAILASDDPMIRLALLVDPQAREIRMLKEDQVTAVYEKNSRLLARARFERDGTSSYPDATFTPRLSYGTVKGWTEGKKEIQPFTNFKGLYDRTTGTDPFALPPSWISSKDKLDLSTPFNFSSTNDVIGGNSGSPVIDREGHAVGLVFDGNIYSIGGDIAYDPVLNRTVSVDTAAIVEALKKVYKDDALIEELRSGATK